MALPIYLYGHKILRQKTRDIDFKKKDEIEDLVLKMHKTMKEAEGVGIAAPQVGLDLRVFLVDTKEVLKEEGINEVFINPKILSYYSKDISLEEGCLSIPEIRANVVRKNSIEIEYFDKNLTKKTKKFTDFNSRVIQHEYDHIEQTLFIDKISYLNKVKIKKKLAQIKKRKVDVNYKFV